MGQRAELAMCALRSSPWFVAFLFGVVVAASPLAASDDDQERARAAAADGRILPLTAIIERALATFGGTVLDVEYEEDDDHEAGDEHHRARGPRYELKLMTADGRVLKLDYDAVSGTLVGQRGHLRRGHRHQEDD